ncbi:MAG: AraC family transcriptional regulator [Lachnospiraceae bacterium]
MEEKIPQDPNGWGVASDEENFLDFPKQDDSGIAVTIWQQRLAVAPHKHHFWEFTLIINGCCVHNYRGVKVPLLPGDVFLIEPGEEHSYGFTTSLKLINCQFYCNNLSELLPECPDVFMPSLQEGQDAATIRRRWDTVLRNIAHGSSLPEESVDTHINYLNRQGVIHLNMSIYKEIEGLLHKMMVEQERKERGYKMLKSALLQIILLTFQRVQCTRAQKIDYQKNKKKEVIYQAISYIEHNLDKKLEIEAIAQDFYMSPGYFRSTFKDVTGLSPNEYIQRLRIIKSLEYIELEGLNFSEAGARVGIYDASHYNRIFKKVIGYSPRYFKKI